MYTQRSSSREGQSASVINYRSGIKMTLQCKATYRSMEGNSS